MATKLAPREVRRPMGPGGQINLLPQEIRTRQRSERMFRMLVVGAVVLAALLAAVYVVQRVTISNERDELRALNDQAAQLRTDVAALKEFEDLQARVDRSKLTLRTALAGDIAWSRFLNDLSIITPDNSWLTNLTLNSTPALAPDGTPAVGNTAFSGFVTNFPGLAGWLNRVETIDGIKYVYLTSGAKQDVAGREVVAFSSTASVSNELLSQRCQQEGTPCP